MLIFSRSEKRQDELYSKIHAPRVATSLADVPGAFEEWDTNQRLYREIGGVPLREDELRNLAFKMVPGVIREQLIFKLRELHAWDDVKEWVREHARLLVVHGRSSPANGLELKDLISDEFMERTDGWE